MDSVSVCSRELIDFEFALMDVDLCLVTALLSGVLLSTWYQSVILRDFGQQKRPDGRVLSM
jgi:hypothetical protein